MLEALTGLTEVFLYYALAGALRREPPTMRTIIGVCLDESSSMDVGGKRAAAVSAFNEYLKTQQDAKLDECLMSVVKFNTKAWVMDKMSPIAAIQPLDDVRYRPSGSTALNDAIIYVVKEIESGMKADDRVLIVVLTDGEENSSEASNEHVKKLIEEYTAKGNFTFVYLSADLNAFHAGAARGFAASNVGQYSNTSRGLGRTMSAMAANTMAYRSSAMPQAMGMSAGVGMDDADDSPAVVGADVNPLPVDPTFAGTPRKGPVARAMTPVPQDAQEPPKSRDIWGGN